MDVAVGEVGRLLCLPRRHSKLILRTTGVLRLRWSRQTWTRLGLRSTSLGSPPMSDKTQVQESSSQETRVPESSSHVTPEASGHADGGEDTFSDDSYSEGELVEGGEGVLD